MRWNHKTLTISFFIQFPQVTAVEQRPVTETLAQVEASGFLDRITRRSVVNADGNKAWKSAAASRGLPFQNVIHQVKNFTSDCPKVWPEVSTVAGTQTLDRSWRSLKTFLPKGMTVKQKIQGHSCMHPSGSRNTCTCGLGDKVSGMWVRTNSWNTWKTCCRRIDAIR